MRIFIITDRNSKLINVSTNEETANLICNANSEYSIREAETKTLGECDDFVIIENNKDNTYCQTYVHPVRRLDNDKYVDMYKCRMFQFSESCIKNDNILYTTDIKAAVAAHLNYWKKDKNLEDVCLEKIYILTKDELSMLCGEGFEADRIFADTKTIPMQKIRLSPKEYKTIINKSMILHCCILSLFNIITLILVGAYIDLLLVSAYADKLSHDIATYVTVLWCILVGCTMTHTIISAPIFSRTSTVKSANRTLLLTSE